MTFEQIEIQCGETVAKVAPGRGALVTGLKVRGKDVLYMDPATLESADASIRGGIPTLFPFAGALRDDLFDQAGTKMPKHGFARNKRWRVTENSADRIRMILDRDEEVRTTFPFQYTVEQTHRALPHGLQTELIVMNMSDSPIPISPGWHPYFICEAARKGEITSDIEEIILEEFTDERQFDFGVIPPLTGRATFRLPGLGTLHLSFSPQMRHLHFWSLPGESFICIEPFAGPPNALNVYDQRILVPPHSALSFFMRMELEDPERAGEQHALAAEASEVDTQPPADWEEIDEPPAGAIQEEEQV